MPSKSASPKFPIAVDKLTVTTAEAAELLNVTPRWIRELAARGLIKKIATDQYLLADVIAGYSKSLEHDERQTRQSKSAQRVFDAKAEELENEIARELELLVGADDVISIYSEIEQAIEEEIAPVPAKIEDPEARAALEKYLDHELGRLKRSFNDARLSLAAGKGLPDLE